MIAKIAAEKSGFTKTKQMIFCIGALIPDLTLMQLVHPHFYSRSGKYIINKINKLSGRTSIYALLELGKSAHYVSDFCCSAHFGGGIGNVFEHILYERNLNVYAAENYSELQGECSLFHDEKSPENVLNEYFQGEKFNFHTDFIAAVRACMSICGMAAENKRSKLNTIMNAEPI